jgi:lipopolysaccharide biosynthesis protein
MSIRTVALYLPQYHPIRENDEWWGTGFTEWRNVAKARPRFRGHYQPHQPGNLGFYDLRNVETMHDQVSLATSHGINAFCFYHYWFNGKLLLEAPVHNYLDDRTLQLPFCLCWANENWTRRWDGMDSEVLIRQNYGDDDDIAHFNYFEPFFHDSRYLRVDGKPVLVVYRRTAIPNVEKMLDNFRRFSQRSGLPDLYIVSVETGPTGIDGGGITTGFDAEIDFQPQWGSLPSLRKLLALGNPYLVARSLLASKLKLDTYYCYRSVIDHMLSRDEIKLGRIPCVFPGWDNSPRRSKNATIFLENSTHEYSRWLSSVIRQKMESAVFSNDLVFINAWNEWGEGAHLEPDLQNGTSYLEATKRVLMNQG